MPAVKPYFDCYCESYLVENTAFLRCSKRAAPNRYADGLQDEENGLRLLDGTTPFFYLIIASVNIAGILVDAGKSRVALERIEGIQAMLEGRPNTERPRLSLRWLRALLLEKEGNYKNACEMMQRVDRRMKKLDMGGERRVLLADYARISKSRDKIRQLAEKAKEIELSRQVSEKIDQVLNNPSAKNVRKWRESLECYMPILPRAA